MGKTTQLLQKMDPRNSLFGRIFVWFWFAVIIMLVTVFSVARYVGQSWQVSAISDTQLTRVQGLFKNVKMQTDRGVDLPRALRRVSSRGRWNLMAVSLSDKDIVLGFPPPLLTQGNKFFALAEAESAVLVRTNNMEFVGPFALNVKNTEFQVFIGRLLPRDQRPAFVIGTMLIVILLLGTLACIAIAWTIARPIKRLQTLSNNFAAGSEKAPDPELLNRKDELGQLHNDIYAMATKLANSLTQQKALLANISHELRTPLTRLQLSIAMLQPNDSNQSKYAQRIEKEINVMDALIGQALQLAKLEDNQAAWVQKQETSLQTVIRPLLDDLQFEAKASNIVLIVQNCPDIELTINATSVHSAIENVTRNAIKFAESQVSICFAEESLGPSKSFLKISIQDDGKGLLQEQYEQIFQPFYQAHSGNKIKGTGLGLSIAKAAIELHNGKISAQQSSMGGLQVDIIIPR